MQKTSIFWFRRDLRLDDNKGLSEALKADEKVIPIFIFDRDILDHLEDKYDRRVDYIHQALEKINQELKEFGSSLLTFHGKPLDVFKQLEKDFEIKSVFCNRDYEPSAIKRDDEVKDFLENLPIGKFYGVGKVTEEKMYQLGIFTGKELKEKTIEYLSDHFGKSGAYYYYVVRGIHNSEVKPDRIAKSVGTEHTFSENLVSEVFMEEKLGEIAEELDRRLRKKKIAGKTVTLKIKYSDFTLQTRSKTLQYFISDKSLILEAARELLYQERLKESVRLLGISLANLNTDVENKVAKQVAVQLKFDF